MNELNELLRTIQEYGKANAKLKKSKKLEDRSALLRKEIELLEAALKLYKKGK